MGLPTPDAMLLAPRNAYLVHVFSGITKMVNPNDSSVRHIFSTYELQGKSDLQTVQNIYNFMTNYMKYSPVEDSPNWQTVHQTLANGEGDCDELSVLQSTFFELGNLPNNWFVLMYNVNWRDYHVANLVYIPPSKTYHDQYLFLDASYPHQIGQMPYYYLQAQVYGFFSTRQPVSNPLLVTSPQPLTIFMQNIAFNKMINFQ